MIRLRPTRLLAIGAVLLVAFLYWKPLHSYVQTKHQLRTRELQVDSLQAQNQKLQKKIALAGTPSELTREARLLGLVKKDERLFIVTGINPWRQRNH
ncbi:MAG TPA: septum formation initiator family protein [Gaiellaceae bacterium]|nr:septum formation initiator family protein [Gaiellaceae bacterium]